MAAQLSFAFHVDEQLSSGASAVAPFRMRRH